MNFYKNLIIWTEFWARLPLQLLPHFLCHSRPGGNKAWFVNNYLILGIIQRYIFYSPAIRNTNLIDPIPALSTPQIHSHLWGPQARE